MLKKCCNSENAEIFEYYHLCTAPDYSKSRWIRWSPTAGFDGIFGWDPLDPFDPLARDSDWRAPSSR